MKADHPLRRMPVKLNPGAEKPRLFPVPRQQLETAAGVEILTDSYTRKGLFAGVAIQGVRIDSDRKKTKKYYRKALIPKAILLD